MAFKGEVYIEGPDGPLEGPRENGTSLVYEFVHEVYLPYETETNRVQGSRRITAFSLTKDIDKITPVLFQYCCEGTKLKKVTIVLYKIKEASEATCQAIPLRAPKTVAATTNRIMKMS